MTLRAVRASTRVLSRIGSLLFVVMVTVSGLAYGAETASAHTEFSGSTPSDGDVLDGPVDTVSLVFTGESEEAGDGFVVLDAEGRIREPTSVSTVDNKVFTLSFEPALAGGEIGVRWSVRAGDNHPIEGSFSFTVTAPAPTGEAAAVGDDGADFPSDTTVSSGSHDMAGMSADEMASMDEFLTVAADRPGESQATLGRLLSFAGVALIIGGIAFLWTTLRGEQGEIRWLVNGIRFTGLALAVGAAIEYSGMTRLAGDSLTSYWSSSPGLAAVMRFIAGAAVAFGLAARIAPVQAAREPRSLSAAANTGSHVDLDAVDEFWGVHDPDLAAVRRTDSDAPSGNGPPRRERQSIARRRSRGRAESRWTRSNGEHEPVLQWLPDGGSALAFVGTGLMVISFWFDGHTVSKGWRPLHAISNSVHVVAGSVWMGGVVALAVVTWMRYRNGLPPRSLELVVRFSGVASVALGAVIAAGLVMAVSVLDSFGDLTGTEWGQLLLLKSGAAGLAMLGGAYNHFQLIPALNREPGDPALRERMRSVVTAEAIVLGFVIVVTAWLVAAAS